MIESLESVVRSLDGIGWAASAALVALLALLLFARRSRRESEEERRREAARAEHRAALEAYRDALASGDATKAVIARKRLEAARRADKGEG